MFPDFSFANQRVVILGLARQGLALANFFCDAGATVTVSDRAHEDNLREELDQLAKLPIDFVLGDHPLSLLDNCDILCLSGGVPPQIEIVQEALRRGIPLTNDVLLTMQLARARGLGPVVAITGSSGKTTTTTLVGKMLQEMGHRVHVGGNIGLPLLDKLSSIHAGEFIVLELSSFQLELFDPSIAWNPTSKTNSSDKLSVGPDLAAIVNITPNHLDRHADMADYASAKLNLLRHLPTDAAVVINADDPVVSRLTDTLQTTEPLPAEWALDSRLSETRHALESATIIPFSQKRLLPTGASLARDLLVNSGHTLCKLSELRLRGDHNVSNVLAAAAISTAAHNKIGSTSHSSTITQLSDQLSAEQKQTEQQKAEQLSATIGRVARTFAGVPHRLEVIAETDNIQWINDSIATSPERTLAGLRSFGIGAQKLILLIGGKDKNLSWETLAHEVNNRVDHLIGFGEVGPLFIELVQEQARFARVSAPNTAVVRSLEQSVILASQFAKSSNAYSTRMTKNNEALVEKPIIVLLSPGGTSYDAYQDFEERGEHFRQLVTGQLATHLKVKSVNGC